MKKICFLLLTVLIVFTLSACDPNSFYFNYDDLKDEVESIELINYNNPEAKVLFEKRDDVIPYDFDKEEILEVLQADRIESFLQDLSKIHFMTSWKHSDSPNGECIKIRYMDGCFEIISPNVDRGYVGSFESDGNVKRFIGNFASKTDIMYLISNFFNAQV